MKRTTTQTVTVDILKDKESKLTQLMQQSTNAVDLVTRTVDNLQSVNSEICNTIAEIEDYQSKLNCTKEGLTSTQSKNSKLISNFKSLLNVD